MVCGQLSRVLVDLFSYDSPEIYTRREPLGKNHEDFVSSSLLLAPAFDQGPLADMDPVSGTTDVNVYLTSLAQRIDRIFDSPMSVVAGEVPKLGWPGKSQLTLDDVVKIRKTWYNLKKLIPYTSGGWYLPTDLSESARKLALSILKSSNYAIYHSDMRMSRIIVDMVEDGHFSLCVYGWEHAYCAPLWSCARMPTWLRSDRPWLTPPPITPEEQKEMRQHIFSTIHNAGTDGAFEWVIAYTFGEVERFIEGCLSAHWMWSDTIEAALRRVKAAWDASHPDVPFPIEMAPQQHCEDTPTPNQPMASVDNIPEEKDTVDPLDDFPVRITSGMVNWMGMLSSVTKHFRPMKSLPRKFKHNKGDSGSTLPLCSTGTESL